MILSLKIVEGETQSLDDLRSRLDVSYEDLFNDALSLLCWAARQREQERLVASIDEVSGTYRELRMTSLEKAARRAKTSTGPKNRIGEVKVIHANFDSKAPSELSERRACARAV